MAELQLREQADRLLGMRVYDVAGRKLGRVQDVTIDENAGEIDCVQVSDDGVLGLFRHRFKVAWSALSYSDTRHALVFAPGVHGEHEAHMPPPDAHGEPAPKGPFNLGA